MQRYDNLTFLMCFPRSRSAWLAAFLKPVAWTMHDPLKQCGSIDELGLAVDAAYSNGADHVFVADTAAVLFFGDLSRRFPDARYLFVHRPMPDVLQSLSKHERELSDRLVDEYARAFGNARLGSSVRRDLHMSVSFRDIDNRLNNIWRFVGNGLLLSKEYAERMRQTNIQIPFDEQARNTDHAKVRRLLSRFDARAARS